MCGVGEKSISFVDIMLTIDNRRPIGTEALPFPIPNTLDPPPAISVTVSSPRGKIGLCFPSLCTELTCSPWMESMVLFCYVQLVNAESGEPVVVPARERQMTPLVGTTNTTFHKILCPEDKSHGRDLQSLEAIFAFTDLSVRQEGTYRLRFLVYQIVDGEALLRAEKLSDKYKVYAAKAFPGMAQSTPFTETLKKCGIRVRVSKSIRATKNFAKKVDPSCVNFDPENDAQQRLLLNRSPSNYEYDGRVIPVFDAWTDLQRAYHDDRVRHPPEGAYPYPPIPRMQPAILPPPDHAAQPLSPTSTNYERPYRPEFGSPWASRDAQPSIQYDRNEYHADYPARRGNEQLMYNHGSMVPQSYPSPRPYSNAVFPSSTRPTPYTTNRRFHRPSTSQNMNEMPHFHYNSGHTSTRDMFPEPHPMGDLRHTASRPERANGNDWTEEQHQPPPPEVPTPPIFYNNNMGMGYQGTNEGYRT